MNLSQAFQRFNFISPAPIYTCLLEKSVFKLWDWYCNCKIFFFQPFKSNFLELLHNIESALVRDRSFIFLHMSDKYLKITMSSLYCYFFNHYYLIFINNISLLVSFQNYWRNLISKGVQMKGIIPTERCKIFICWKTLDWKTN